MLVAPLILASVVSAATTISTNIATGGTLSVTGTSTLMGNVGIGTTTPTENLVVSNPSSTATLSLRSAGAAIGAGNIRFDMYNGDGNRFSWQYAGSGGTALKLQYNTGTKALFSSTGQLGLGVAVNSLFNMLNIGGSAAIGSTYYAQTAPTNGLLVEGNVGIATTSPFVPLSVEGNANIHGNLTVTGTTNGVKVYRALLTQSGTSAPVATVLENSLGGTVVWTRSSGGIYVGTLPSSFPETKTWIGFLQGDGPGANGFWVRRTSDDNITLTLDSEADSQLTARPIEILVYP